MEVIIMNETKYPTLARMNAFHKHVMNAFNMSPQLVGYTKFIVLTEDVYHMYNHEMKKKGHKDYTNPVDDRFKKYKNIDILINPQGDEFDQLIMITSTGTLYEPIERD